MTTVSKEVRTKSNVAHLRRPSPTFCARDGLAARGEDTTLDIHVLHIPFQRDRLSERDRGRNGA